MQTERENKDMPNPQFLIPAVSIEDVAVMLKNLEEARAFCKEFYERRDEFI